LKGCDPVTVVVTSVEDNLFMLFAYHKHAEGLHDVAIDKLIFFTEAREDDMLRIREEETRITYPLMQATVGGKMDVTLHDDEGIGIRDKKTF